MTIADARVSGTARRGQFVVLTMIAIAIAAATFAWWWNYNRGRESLEFFGPDAATLIRTATKVEYLRSPTDDRIDISQAAGLLNARTSLLSDASYEWDQPNVTPSPPFPRVRFSEDGRSVEVAFDFENRTLSTSSTGRTATLTRRTADGWRAYLSRQEKATGPAAPSSGGD